MIKLSVLSHWYVAGQQQTDTVQEGLLKYLWESLEEGNGAGQGETQWQAAWLVHGTEEYQKISFSFLKGKILHNRNAGVLESSSGQETREREEAGIAG